MVFALAAYFMLSIQTGFAQITATQMGMLDFKVSQSLTANDMNGTNDVTTKLQAAVDAARLANKTLFIPSGTYKVSNTIDCVLEFSGWSMVTPVNIVGSSITRPTIVLANSASGFSGTNPKCIFNYRATVHTTPDCIMEGGIRSLNFDLGTGNTKAVALNWGCAQYCFIEDISIEARSGFAGVLAIGGANQLLANISVNGGQYGLYLPNANEASSWGLSGQICQSTITGCTFTNQSVSAIRLWGYGGITMSGITISQASGTAIIMKDDSYSPVIQFPFSLIDSKITFTSSSSSNVAIQNLTHMNVALYGVYVTGAGTIVNNNGDENLAALTPITNWTRVARFNYVDKAIRKDANGTSYTGKNYDAIGGILSNTAIVQTDATAPPADLTSKHIWSSTPSFEDADAFLVTDLTASGIQTAINSHTKVCLPKATISLSAPITLKANTILFGCPGFGKCGTVFTNGFTPTSANWLIETENSAAATTYLMDIATQPANIDYMGSLHWMAGANSIIRTVHLDKGWTSNEANIIRLYFTNNGGGRVFNYQDEKAYDGAVTNSNHRKVKISGTSQQLTFYGLNLERGGALYPVSSWPMLEIVNASKVRIFGAKTEAFQPYATINGCNDIFITNVVDYCANGYGTTGANQIEITGTNDKIELSNLIWLGPPATSWKLVLDPWNTNEPNRYNHIGVYHRNWSTISDLTTPVNIPVTGVTLSPATLSIGTGATGQLTATIAPANATNKNVSWSSNNTAIATVNASGLVTAVAVGFATITVTTVDGSKTATCAVTVTSAPTNIALNKTATASSFETANTVAMGNDGNLTTRWCALDGNVNHWWKVDLGALSDITGTEITWERNFAYKYKIEVSTDNSTWTMAADKTANTTTNTVMSDNFSTSSRYVRITITGLAIDVWASFFEFKVWGSAAANVPVTGVTLSPSTLSLSPGSTGQLTATVAPTNATNKNVTWSSSNTAIATVSSSGLVTAIAAGTATIAVTTVDGAKTATCIVTVTSAPTNIALNKTATASSVETGNTVAMGNDGNISTRWCSVDGTLNQWWKVDLGSVSSITGTEGNLGT
jgi:uncharacterized protein YjdB